VIADLSVNHVERFVLRYGWTMQRTTHDYGVDLMMETYNVDGEPESGRVLFQLKATDRVILRDTGQTVAVRLDRRDIEAWRFEPMPVILVLYDAKETERIGFTCNLISWDVVFHEQAHATRTVYLPRRQVVNRAAIRKFANLRDGVMRRIRGVIFDEE
jgi:hypothetical protein